MSRLKQKFPALIAETRDGERYFGQSADAVQIWTCATQYGRQKAFGHQCATLLTIEDSHIVLTGAAEVKAAVAELPIWR